jgi:hypothetical protein
MTMVDGRLFALSTGPSKTELLELTSSVIDSRYLIQDATTTNGSIVFVPSSKSGSEGKLYIYLDGTMHSYHLPSKQDDTLIRVGGINMKVLNGGLKGNDDPITSMEYFDGITYFLREKRNTIEGWDLNSAALVTEMSLPTILENDKWVGMAFQREVEEVSPSSLRKSKKAAATSSQTVTLHMPLDSFPPQIWSFHLDEKAKGLFSFPDCDGVAVNYNL